MDPNDEKLLHEFDQLAERLGDSSEVRLTRLAAQHTDRDDLTVTIASLMVDLGRPIDAREVLLGRNFQPWEGGEGQVLAVWDRANLEMARAALATGDAHSAIDLIGSAFSPPPSLGEARHPLANASELHLVAGDAHAAAGDDATAMRHWRAAAEANGDFARMATVRFSKQSWFSIQAMQRLGEFQRADTLRLELQEWVAETGRTPAAIDYFATSLPSMLLFIDDPAIERDAELAVIRRQIGDSEAHEASDQRLARPFS